MHRGMICLLLPQSIQSFLTTLAIGKLILLAQYLTSVTTYTQSVPTHQVPH